MKIMKSRIEKELQIPTFDPANGQAITLQLENKIPIQISSELIQNAYEAAHATISKDSPRPITSLRIQGIVVQSPSTGDGTRPKLYLERDNDTTPKTVMNETQKSFKRSFNPFPILMQHQDQVIDVKSVALAKVFTGLQTWLEDPLALTLDNHYTLYISKSLKLVCASDPQEFAMTLFWDTNQEDLAVKVLAIMNASLP